MVSMTFAHTSRNRSIEPGSVPLCACFPSSKATETSPTRDTYACASNASFEP